MSYGVGYRLQKLPTRGVENNNGCHVFLSDAPPGFDWLGAQGGGGEVPSGEETESDSTARRHAGAVQV